MKKQIVSFLTATLLAFTAQGQLSLNGHFYGEDLLKFNLYNQSGTAKVNAMGGSFTALGADISSALLNPAGLGFYNKSEFSITPFFGSNLNTSTYIGKALDTRQTDLKMGQVGAVFSSRGTGTRKKRSSWAINYANLVNFNNSYSYGGANSKSSISDYFAQRATDRNVSSTVLDGEFDNNTGQAQNITSLAYWAYLVEPMKNNEYGVAEISFPVNQIGNVTTKGGLGQINVGYGANYDNKTYLGLGIGIQNLSHTTLTELSESFPQGKVFDSYRFYDELYVSGTGLNINAGLIYKFVENVRVGVSVTSPTAMRIEETYISNIDINPRPNAIKTDFTTFSTVPNDFNYKVTSPLRASTGVSVFLPKKMGALNLDLEYVGYSRMGLKDVEDAKWSSEQKAGIQNEFKDVINVKGGGELRFGMARIRGGLGYFQEPRRNTSNANLNTGRLQTSLGVGVRTERFFIDASFTARPSSFAFTPYTVANVADYASAAVKSNNRTVGITLGTFF
jgi:hypothetical protein